MMHKIEAARIDNPIKDKALLGTKEVWVYSNDTSSKMPHFHYLDRTDDKRFEVEVNIDDLSICSATPKKNDLMSWKGLEQERKSLLEWLNRPNSDLPIITNYVSLKLAWNQNNCDKPITI